MPEQSPHGAHGYGDEQPTQELPVGAPQPGTAVGGPSRPAWLGGRVVVTVAAVVVLLLVSGVAGAMLGRGGGEPTGAGQAPEGAMSAPPGTASAPTRVTAGAPALAVAQVQVVGSGFTQLRPEPDGDVKATWAVVLRNPSRDRIDADVRVQVTFRNAAGHVLATDEKDLDLLLPGQTGALSEKTDVSGATTMDVAASAATTQATAPVPGDVRAVSVRTSRTPTGKTETVATLRSTLTERVDADSVAVWYNQSGRILGGTQEGMDEIPPGSSLARLDTSSAPPNIARTEVYVTLKSLPPGR